MMFQRTLGVAAATLTLSISANAYAGALDTYNLITLGDFYSSSNTYGPVFVGGTYSGPQGDLGQRIPHGTDVPAIAVLGGININNGINVGGGNVVLDNDINKINEPDYINFNGGGQLIYTELDAEFAAIQTEVSDMATFFSSLEVDQSYSVATPVSSKVEFSGSTPGADSLTVIDLEEGFFTSERNFDLYVDSSDSTVLFNIAGDVVDFSLMNIKMNGSIDPTSVIWNFYEATTVKLTDSTYGAIFAPNAAVSGATLNGSAIVGSLWADRQVHTPLTGFPDLPDDPNPAPPTVPTPSAALAGMALLALTVTRRR